MGHGSAVPATLAAWQLLRDVSTESVINDMFEATKKQELLAIPFFVLAGNLMTSGAMYSTVPQKLNAFSSTPSLHNPIFFFLYSISIGLCKWFL